MSVKALQDYTLYSRYAKYVPNEKRRETWEETVNRVFEMHEKKYKNALSADGELRDLFGFAKEQVLKKRVLGSQRALQFGGEPIEKHEAKMYNCSFGHVDRSRFFQECMYLLLCGCGVGFSVQKKHVKNLPTLQYRNKGTKKYTIPDSIEGWSDAIGIVVNSYFKDPKTFSEYSGYKVQFDYSEIRPEGSYISGGFKAPGPNGLKSSIEKIEKLIESRIEDSFNDESEFKFKLRPIDAYDVIMHMSDAVLSGGVRRSATICLFSWDDNEMLNAKTGNWFNENPQRGRSNNSVVLLKDKTKKEDFKKIMESVKQFGEPGFVWTEDEDIGFNPCVEIGLYPKTEDGRSGFQFCNLTEINGKKCSSEEAFLEACKASAILGTLQAGYTNFKYVSDETREITEREALLGCSITGMMDSPDVLFDTSIQRKGAKLIRETNKIVAEMIGINIAARTTAIKPAGSTSCILGTSSGIHPHHARRYFRRVQANKLEFPLKEFTKHNPHAIQESVWSSNKTDMVITFLCEVPQGSVVKNQLSAVELLDKVKNTQQNWVEYGTNKENCVLPNTRHNVSNTITILDDEWGDVTDYIYNNRKWFAGISLLPASGDKDYPQAPFTTVYTPSEIVREYGDASVFASGLIVDGLSAFDNNLWAACDAVLGRGESIPNEMEEPVVPERPKKNGYNTSEYNKKLINHARAYEDYYIKTEQYDKWWSKKDWIRRANQFAERYFGYDNNRVLEIESKLGDVFEDVNEENISEYVMGPDKKDIRKLLAELKKLKFNLKRMTYCLKDVSNWKTWCDLRREYKDVDWTSVVEEDEFFINVDETAGAACAGGACEVNF